MELVEETGDSVSPARGLRVLLAAARSAPVRAWSRDHENSPQVHGPGGLVHLMDTPCPLEHFGHPVLDAPWRVLIKANSTNCLSSDLTPC